MKYFATEKEFKNAQKEKTLGLKNALLNRIEWCLKNCERKNLNKEKRQSYDYLKIRIEHAYAGEFENFKPGTVRIELINWFLKNNLTIKDMSKHVFFTIDGDFFCDDSAIKIMTEPVKNIYEAKRLYDNSLHLLSNIYSNYACDQIWLEKLGY